MASYNFKEIVFSTLCYAVQGLLGKEVHKKTINLINNNENNCFKKLVQASQISLLCVYRFLG